MNNNKQKIKKILFVSTRSGIAGVETLIMRMIAYLSKNDNIQTALLLMSKGKNKEFINFVEKNCPIYYGSNISDYKKIKSEQYDFIYTFSLFPLIFSLFIKRFFLKKARLSFGVYHPLEYCWKHGIKSYIQKISHRILNIVPLENIFFMNYSIMERHSKYSNRDFTSSPIIPLPVDVERFKNIERIPKKKQNHYCWKSN